MDLPVLVVRLGRLTARAWQQFEYALAMCAERRELASLDDAALKDLGISRAQAAFEASRAPWDAGTRLGEPGRPPVHPLGGLKLAD